MAASFSVPNTNSPLRTSKLPDCTAQGGLWVKSPSEKSSTTTEAGFVASAGCRGLFFGHRPLRRHGRRNPPFECAAQCQSQSHVWKTLNQLSHYALHVSTDIVAAQDCSSEPTSLSYGAAATVVASGVGGKAGKPGCRSRITRRLLFTLLGTNSGQGWRCKTNTVTPQVTRRFSQAKGGMATRRCIVALAPGDASHFFDTMNSWAMTACRGWPQGSGTSHLV